MTNTINETANVAKVASKMPGGMKVVGISAATTLTIGTAVYFAGKKIVNKVKAKRQAVVEPEEATEE